jgi:hypothetical protein
MARANLHQDRDSQRGKHSHFPDGQDKVRRSASAQRHGRPQRATIMRRATSLASARELTPNLR